MHAFSSYLRYGTSGALNDVQETQKMCCIPVLLLKNISNKAFGHQSFYVDESSWHIWILWKAGCKTCIRAMRWWQNQNDVPRNSLTTYLADVTSIITSFMWEPMGKRGSLNSLEKRGHKDKGRGLVYELTMSPTMTPMLIKLLTMVLPRLRTLSFEETPWYKTCPRNEIQTLNSPWAQQRHHCWWLIWRCPYKRHTSLDDPKLQVEEASLFCCLFFQATLNLVSSFLDFCFFPFYYLYLYHDLYLYFDFFSYVDFCPLILCA